MKVMVKTINPYVARMMLANNINNRPLNKRRIMLYVEDMQNGRWSANGESIVVTESGLLVDGQHRLHAVADAGVAIDFVIATIPDSEAKNFDVGRSRSIKDSAKIYGNGLEKLNEKIVNGCSFLLTVENNYLAVSESKKVQFLEENLEFLLSFQERIGFSNGTFSQGAIVASMLVAYHNGYPLQKIEKFYNVLTDGVVTNVDEIVIIKLRDYLMKNTRGGREKRTMKYRMACYTLYAYAKGLKTSYKERSHSHLGFQKWDSKGGVQLQLNK